MNVATTPKLEQMLSGHHHELGAHWDGDGVNFALYSAHAERVELCLFDDSGMDEVKRYVLPRQTNQIWHGYIPGLSPGTVYGYRVYGRYEPEAGYRFNPNKLVVDPYARQLTGKFQWSDTHFAFRATKTPDDRTFDKRDNAAFTYKCVVTAPFESLPRTSKPHIPWSQTTLYETHVRGFSIRHPEVPELQRGTFAGLAHTQLIDYLKGLGITSVELLPIHACVDEYFLHQKGLRNYWGYNSLSFFAPNPRYQSSTQLAEIRSMIDCYHDAGIEVILDVVYNHTCESDHLGPTLSYRGIDNATYYQLQAERPRYYVNDTGCGNTINAQHPTVVRLVMDSLRYWSKDMGVDGFRFDLASTLGRGKGGYSSQANLFQAISQDPTLTRTKLIAEPWDIGPGGYQLGKFPVGWSEWNDRYRDTIRSYWRREPGILPTFARRIHGSSDIFEHSGKSPYASINYVTSHDGFTLNDLVSFVERHNLANGESNRDGHRENLSQNYGVEGVTDDPEINAARARAMRNMLATLFVSQGVPMILGGDEFARTQRGNNNAYCQDNELNWLDWSTLYAGDSEATQHGKLIARLIALTRRFPMLRHHRFVHPPRSPEGISISWLNAEGEAMLQDHWADRRNYFLAYLISEHRVDQADQSVLVIFNNDPQPRKFIFPPLPNNHRWVKYLDTCNPDGIPATSSVPLSSIEIAETSVAIFYATPAE